MKNKFFALLIMFSLFGLNISQASAFADSLGKLTEVIPVGKTLTVSLNNTNNNSWTVSNNNPEIISAIVTNNLLVITGKNFGVATAYACVSNTTNCLKTTVSVVSLNVLGAATSEIEASLQNRIGSWIKAPNDQTVFYVHQDGLIPVPSLNVFYKNGGSLNEIKTMDEYDLQEFILSVMVASDPRVQ